MLHDIKSNCNKNYDSCPEHYSGKKTFEMAKLRLKDHLIPMQDCVKYFV